MATEQLKALIVDDDEEWRDILRPLLEERFIVRTAIDYRSAKKELGQDTFSLVTVDMGFMKGTVELIEGGRLLKYIKQHHKGTQCIVVSGSVLLPEDLVDWAREYGFVGYMNKDRFDYDRFERQIDEAVAAHLASLGGGTLHASAKPERTPGTGKRPIKILFLGANPSNTVRLRLDEEARAIDQAIRQAEFRDKFDIKQHWAVRTTELQGCLLRHKPDIVHFSGHGSESSEIILMDNSGNNRAVSTRALSKLFSVLKDNIRCVVLNACYSERQAQAIAQHIDCVIGMSEAIGDAAAISFASAFYQAIGFGRDVKTAFDLGCVEIDIEKLGEQDIPKLIAIKSNPEEILFVRGR